MECSICLENFYHELKLPILLDCGHTFCTSCLDTILLGHPSCPQSLSFNTNPLLLIRNDRHI